MKKFTILLFISFVFVTCNKNTNQYNHSTVFKKDINNKISQQDFERVLNNTVSSNVNNNINNYIALSNNHSVYENEILAKENLTPLYNESINLLGSYGLLEELVIEFGSIDDPRFIEAALIINEIEKNIGSSADWADCLFEASGIKGVATILSQGVKESIEILGVKGVAKIIGKAVGRSLGWAGTIVMAIDFIHCVGTQMEEPIEENTEDSVPSNEYPIWVPL